MDEDEKMLLNMQPENHIEEFPDLEIDQTPEVDTDDK